MGRLITLGVVEKAMEQERRVGDEDRRAKPEPPKAAPFLPVLLFLLGLVVAASTWNFTRLETDYQGFKSDEIGRHERDAALHEKMDGRLGAVEKALSERSVQNEKQTRIQKAIARKLGVKVEE